MIWNTPPQSVPAVVSPFEQATRTTLAVRPTLVRSLRKSERSTLEAIEPCDFVPSVMLNVPPVAPTITCCTWFGLTIALDPSGKSTRNAPPGQLVTVCAAVEFAHWTNVPPETSTPPGRLPSALRAYVNVPAVVVSPRFAL